MPVEFIAAVCGVMQACPQHDFQLLTKRPERAAEFHRWLTNANVKPLGDRWAIEASCCCMMARAHGVTHTNVSAAKGDWPPRNCWLGTSVEDQKTAAERIPHLLNCPAAVR